MKALVDEAAEKTVLHYEFPSFCDGKKEQTQSKSAKLMTLQLPPPAAMLQKRIRAMAGLLTREERDEACVLLSELPTAEQIDSRGDKKRPKVDRGIS